MKSQNKNFTAPCPQVEQRISDMIAKLTLEEKIDLLGGQKEPKDGGDTYGNKKAGIPPIKFADASVGVHWWTDRSTTYPATIALAASWDRDLAYKAGAALGRDCLARGIHVVLGPGVNIYRSPLCGRNFEYLGEDPYLSAESVTGWIKGLQDQGVSATVKHYAANYQEYDRHGVSSDIDERTLREVYLPAFRAAIEEAGSGAVMTSYNLVNCVHASEHDVLLRQILKGEWGFQGLVMSDWVSVYSAVNAANAGLDLEMPTAKWMNREQLLPAVKNGLVSESVIDDKVRRLLRLMVCFGWLDHEQLDKNIPLEDESTAAVSLEIARRGCVLLKNKDSFLPLDAKKIKSIAVIGPNAENTPFSGGGSAWNKPWRSVSILEGLRQKFGADKVRHAIGLMPDNSDRAFANAKYLTPDGKPGIKAEYFGNSTWAGTPVISRVEPRIEQRWGSGAIGEGLPEDGFSARWTGKIVPENTGTYIFYQWFGAPFRVLFDGKPIFDLLDGATLMPPRVVLPLQAGSEHTIEVLYRSRSGFNGACVGYEFVDSTEKLQEAINIAKESDVVVFCGGFHQISEAEGCDRDFAMRAEYEELLIAIAKVNPKIAVVINSGGNIDMRRWIDSVPALLYAWFAGQEGGTAIADILAGDVNPSGKLPATFERALEDRSSFNSYKDMDGDKRVMLSDGIFTGYRHHDRTGVAPQFAFGFGLSYTTFAYENLRCAPSMAVGGSITASVDIVNTGKRAGIEVAQLYLRDCASSLPRPVKELKGYAAVELKPGERKTVEFTLTERHLQFFDPEKHAWVAEAGDFEIMIGASSADIKLKKTFAYSK